MIKFILVLLLWIIAGFIAFILLAKDEGYTELNKEVKDMFGLCLFGGAIVFILAIVYTIAVTYCNNFLEWLLKIINGDKKK